MTILGKTLPTAYAEQSITILPEDEIDISRGFIDRQDRRVEQQYGGRGDDPVTPAGFTHQRQQRSASPGVCFFTVR